MTEKENQVLENTVKRCRERKIILPTYRQMRNPELIPEKIKEALKNIGLWDLDPLRSEEHTSELQSHSFISYAVFCLKKKKTLPTDFNTL